MWTPSTSPITMEELRTAVSTHRVLVVHCWAIWDGYDRTVDGVIRALRPEFEAEIAFRSLDMDALSFGGASLAKTLAITVPTLLCFVDGGFERRIVGVRPAKALRRILQELVVGT